MEIYFTKEHEWVKVDGNVGTIGISDYAAHQLGDVTFVDLPQTGKTVKQFDVVAGIESVKAASDIYAPLSGKVTKVNDALDSTPEIVNDSPEDGGWIAQLDLSDPAEVKNLMTKAQYDEFVRGLE